MKKILFLFVLFLVNVVPAFAMDCFQDPILDRDYNAEAIQGVFVRDVACMEGSTVLATLKANEVVHVIAFTDGWYKVVRSDGTTGWVGMQFLLETSRAFAQNSTNTTPPPSNSPLYDVVGHKYAAAVWYLYSAGIVNGYSDGSYKPDQTISRAELLKIVVEATFDDDLSAYSRSDCFIDVKKTDWYSKYVCFAKEKGIINGYSDGTFKPSQEIKFVEALKIAMIGFSYEYDEELTPWYQDLVMIASDMKVIPYDVTKFYQNFSRAQMAELITRVLRYKEGTLDSYLGDDSSKVIKYTDIEQ